MGGDQRPLSAGRTGQALKPALEEGCSGSAGRNVLGSSKHTHRPLSPQRAAVPVPPRPWRQYLCIFREEAFEGFPRQLCCR